MSDTSLARRQKTIESLEEYYSGGVAEGQYLGHQPVYGFGGPGQEAHHIVFLARVFHILSRINSFEFDSFLDVGGGEGYTANLVREIFGGYCVSADLSFQANLRARQLFNLDSMALDASRLPFADNAFDVVLCSEVIEHLEHPIIAIRELMRVSRYGLILSTMESALSLYERGLLLRLRHPEMPHAELNFWHPSDFVKILGSDGLTYSHIINVREYAEAAYDDSRFTEESAWKLIGRMQKATSFGCPYGRGLLVIKRKNGSKPVHRIDDTELLRLASITRVPLNYKPYPEPDWIATQLEERIRCPISGSVLLRNGDSLHNSAAGLSYPVSNGIPNMVPAQALENRSPDEVLQVFSKLFSPSNVASSSAAKRICKGLLRLLERMRSLRERRARTSGHDEHH